MSQLLQGRPASVAFTGHFVTVLGMTVPKLYAYIKEFDERDAGSPVAHFEISLVLLAPSYVWASVASCSRLFRNY